MIDKKYIGQISEKTSSKFSEKYSISNNTFITTPKDNPKDSIKVEIGDSKQPEFYPQVKLMRWDNEVNFSVRLIDDEETIPTISTDDLNIEWNKNQKGIKFYEIPTSTKYVEGGYEFEITLKEKPRSNRVNFSMMSKGLDFFYQPPLTKSQIKSGYIRQDNVIGSYAVYYKNCPTNYVGAKEYRTGKAFHIYRPKIEDALGRWTWGSLTIDTTNDLLYVDIPQDFLDTAAYPITHAAGLTIGYTSVGSTYGGGVPNVLYGIQATGAEGIATSISAYYASAPGYQKGVLVKCSDKSIIPNGVTSPLELDYSSPEWHTSNYSVTPSITAQDYYVCVIFSDAQQTSPFVDVISEGLLDDSNSYSNPTNPTDSTTGYRYSIYCTYEAGGGSTDISISSPTATASSIAKIPTITIINAPIMNITDYTKTKISDETGMTTSTVTFQSDIDLLEWEARAGGSGVGEGLLVGSGSTATANTDITFDVDYTELTQGDQTYRINVYGRNASGWSTYG